MRALHGWKEPASSFYVHFHLVRWCRRWTFLVVLSHKSYPHQPAHCPDFQRLQQHPWEEASGKTPAEPRSLEWDVWPNGQPSSEHRLWAQPLQLLQLHGHGAHADPRRQPPRFPVPRWRRCDLHHRSRRFAALRSIQQQQKHQLAEFPQCSDLQASGNRWQVMCRVVQASRKLGFGQRICCNNDFLVHKRKGREIETYTSCIRWKIERISAKSLSGKLNWPSEERNWLSKKRRSWGRRGSQTLGKEKLGYRSSWDHQELESQRFQLQQASRWADQAQRDEVSLYGELELRNRLFQESQAKDCQEIEELRRICCEDADRARQPRIDESSVHQERKPTTVGQLLTQIQELPSKANSLSDAREFYDPESGSSTGATHVPSQLSTFLSLRTLPRRDFWIAARYMECYEYFRKRFGTTICSRRTVLYNLQQFKKFSIVFSIIETWCYRNYKDKREWNEREPLSTSIPSHQFQSGSGILNPTGGTYTHSGVMGYPRLPISDMHLRNFLALWNFKAEKSTSRMKCAREQQILRSLCTGSKKLRLQSQLTNLRHRDRLWDEPISLISTCLVRWLRLHWRSFSTRTWDSCSDTKASGNRSPQNPWAESWIGRPRREIGSAKKKKEAEADVEVIGKGEILTWPIMRPSGVRISTIPATTSQSMGRSGSKRQN